MLGKLIGKTIVEIVKVPVEALKEVEKAMEGKK